VVTRDRSSTGWSPRPITGHYRWANDWSFLEGSSGPGPARLTARVRRRRPRVWHLVVGVATRLRPAEPGGDDSVTSRPGGPADLRPRRPDHATTPPRDETTTRPPDHPTARAM
jgi:hypothetical protein